MGDGMLRLARKADAPVIHALIWAAKEDIPLTGGYPNCEWIEDHCKQRDVWVLEEQCEIAGAMIMDLPEICYLVVQVKHRRKGIGKMLISEAKRLHVTKRRNKLTAKTRRENTPIVRLLASEGFHKDWEIQANNPDWDVYSWKKP
jgi:ribosomal protein S18 acetylase RimI-like enzyme